MICVAVLLYIPVLLFRNMDNIAMGATLEFLEGVVSILEVLIIYYLFSRLVERKSSIVKNKIYLIFEHNSFGIYLFHQQVIYFTIYWFNGLVSPIVQVMLSLTIALFTSLAMSALLRKFRVSRFMFGLGGV